MSRNKNTYNFKKLKSAGDKIVLEFENLFREYEGAKFKFLIYPYNMSIWCAFAYTIYNDSKDILKMKVVEDNDETFAYSKAVYVEETSGRYSGYLSGAERGIYSKLKKGSRMGQMLFKLQLLLVINAGVRIFDLDNFTGDPGRAAEPGGIYEDLKIDFREFTDHKSLAGTSLNDKLFAVDGKMRYDLASDSKKLLFNNLYELLAKLLTTELPYWNYEAILHYLLAHSPKFRTHLTRAKSSSSRSIKPIKTRKSYRFGSNKKKQKHKTKKKKKKPSRKKKKHKTKQSTKRR